MGHTDNGPPGREQAFRRLYEATYADLLRFIERRVHPTHAEDVLADVFLVAWRRIDDVPRPHDEARAWLFGVAHRTLRSQHRSGERHRAVAVRIADAQLRGPDLAGPEPDLVAARLDLAEAWRRLSAVHQEALALAVWDGLSAPEAAEVLGISPVAYRLRLSRARRALRALAGTHPHTSPTAAPAATRSTP
ncbi:RNA polymerase subunit sigma-70 [Nocardioides gansuensis]|uniref:RNA polymerase subunit sigma-70 n=1 Tax=Nocardioides gansuensis TaxID=2138300 RepID=A0A2T8F5X9_9ACTN|nr:RNA polymerase sigma factor [Nocardioides gansuensis]PVG81111.1 RNA polymerase subunit sigma-70 [Nocardioides gansuensis]